MGEVKTVNILGHEWVIERIPYHDYERFERLNLSGECIYFKRCIVYCKMSTFPGYDDIGDTACTLEENEILRHEIIHAMLFESGLLDSWEHKNTGHDETFIDWYAIQYPKLHKIYGELDIEE